MTLSACARSGTSALPPAAVTANGASAQSAAVATGTLTIVVPPVVATAIRKATWVSSATTQAALFIDNVVQAAGSSTSCSTGCTIGYKTTAGPHTMRVEISNSANVVLAEGTGLAFVVAGSGNLLSIVLNGAADMAAWASTVSSGPLSITGTYAVEDASAIPITSAPAGASTSFDNGPISFFVNRVGDFVGSAGFNTGFGSTQLAAPDAHGNDYTFTASCGPSANGIFTITATTASSATGISGAQLSGLVPPLSYPPTSLNTTAMHPYSCTAGVIADRAASFIYVVNSSSNNVSAFAINLTSGALTAVPGSPFAAGNQPRSVAATPNGSYVYVANFLADTISAYKVNTASGALTTIGGSPFATSTNPLAIATSPNGAFVYTANAGNNTISAYTINAGSGALTAVAGSPFATGAYPDGITITPNGSYLYTTNFSGNNVSAYTINAVTGALTAVAGSPFAVASGAETATTDSGGLYLYVNSGTAVGVVSAFDINAGSGALTAVAGSPFGTGQSFPTSAVVPSTAPFLYAANQSNSISEFGLNASTGVLSLLASSPQATGSIPTGLSVTPLGTFLFAPAQGDNDVNGYAINASTGALTLVPGSPFPTGSGPVSSTIVW